MRILPFDSFKSYEHRCLIVCILNETQVERKDPSCHHSNDCAQSVNRFREIYLEVQGLVRVILGVLFCSSPHTCDSLRIVLYAIPCASLLVSNLVCTRVTGRFSPGGLRFESGHHSTVLGTVRGEEGGVSLRILGRRKACCAPCPLEARSLPTHGWFDLLTTA